MGNVIIIDGPEAAGKTTLIQQLWPDAQLRDWGPIDSATEYLDALQADLLQTEFPLVVWDRSWASEVVYNDLLKRGRNEEEVIDYLETFDVLKIMVLTSPLTLRVRRIQRQRDGFDDDLPIEPFDEHQAFMQFAHIRNWATISGDDYNE